MSASKTDRQYIAKILFCREHLDQKTVAKRVGVSEVTLSKWAIAGNWKALKNRLLISKDEQLNALYEQLEALNETIRDSDTKHADTKQADILIKYTAAIRNLETDLAIADIVESGIRFIKFLQANGTIEQMQDIVELWHSFIQASIKK